MHQTSDRPVTASSTSDVISDDRLVFRPDVLKGRTALITGGSSGIGLGIAEVFALLGANVMIVGRDPIKLELAKTQLAELSDQITTRALDIRHYDAVADMVTHCVQTFGTLDILVNNAAGNFHCPLSEMSPNGWRSVVDIDLNGTFNCCHASFEALKASAFGARIINISLAQAMSGWPGSAHAASAKAGVTALTRSLAVEWGPYGIRVNNVLPGPIENTEGLKRLYEDRGQAEQERNRMALGMFGQLDDIAQACVFLAAPSGGFITGCDMTVDGGRWLKRQWV